MAPGDFRHWAAGSRLHRMCGRRLSAGLAVGYNGGFAQSGGDIASHRHPPFVYHANIDIRKKGRPRALPRTRAAFDRRGMRDRGGTEAPRPGGGGRPEDGARRKKSAAPGAPPEGPPFAKGPFGKLKKKRPPYRPADGKGPRPLRGKPGGPGPRDRDEGEAPDSQRGERLQKVLAAAGIGSRRQCEELITTGRVKSIATWSPSWAPGSIRPGQEIRVDGEVLARQQQVYYAVNKPDGVVSTNRDPSGRPRVIDLLPDGDTAVSRRAARPAQRGPDPGHQRRRAGQSLDPSALSRCRKTYRVLVAGRTERRNARASLDARHPPGRRCRPGRKVTVQVAPQAKSTVLEIVLREGRNREIRRLLARVGHKVLRLMRTAVGPVSWALPPAEPPPAREELGRPAAVMGSREQSVR